jgi:hypothetical protein
MESAPPDPELALKPARLALGGDTEKAPHRYSMWGFVFS